MPKTYTDAAMPGMTFDSRARAAIDQEAQRIRDAWDKYLQNHREAEQEPEAEAS
jgi:hypothetical protein